ncbi:hypothetical protein QE152_g34427 [Popillia japonica]|uniref:Uncharacterized protein n=1 Tax=Popillia japonica TaxID=7064 RepID=A0AAW1ITH1_POPJA
MLFLEGSGYVRVWPYYTAERELMCTLQAEMEFMCTLQDICPEAEYYTAERELMCTLQEMCPEADGGAYFPMPQVN